jgi:hypothetical protein
MALNSIKEPSLFFLPHSQQVAEMSLLPSTCLSVSIDQLTTTAEQIFIKSDIGGGFSKLCPYVQNLTRANISRHFI